MRNDVAMHVADLVVLCRWYASEEDAFILQN